MSSRPPAPSPTGPEHSHNWRTPTAMCAHSPPLTTRRPAVMPNDPAAPFSAVDGNNAAAPLPAGTPAAATADIPAAASPDIPPVASADLIDIELEEILAGIAAGQIVPHYQ